MALDGGGNPFVAPFAHSYIFFENLDTFQWAERSEPLQKMYPSIFLQLPPQIDPKSFALTVLVFGAKKA